jgi:hypothetical protein
MGAKVRETGGGANVGTSNAWNQFLNQQLSGGSQQGGPTGNFMPGLSGLNPQLQGMINQGVSNSQQPQQQQQGFQQAFQGMLGGNVRDVSGAGQAISDYFAKPEVYRINNETFSNPYTAQTFQSPTTTALPTNFGSGMTGMADLSRTGDATQSNVDLNRGFGTRPQNINAAQSTFNAMQGYGQQAPNVSAAQSMFNTQASLGPTPTGGAFDQMLMDLINRGSGAEAQSGFNEASVQPQVQLGQAAQVDLNNPLVAAQLEGIRRAETQAAADLRARFGAEGAGALGTGAQFAEAQLRSEFAPRQAAILQQSIQQQQAQDLAERQAQAQTALGGRGMDVQTAIANMQGGLQGAQNVNQFNTANLANLLQAATAGRGQSLQTGLGVRGQNLEQLGLGAQQAALNAQLQQQAGLANAQNFLQSRGMDINQLSLAQQQSLANAQAMQQASMQNAANALQARGMDINQMGLQAQQGQFNAGQANALQQAMLNARLQNQQLGNQFGLGAASLNQQAREINNANALAAAQMGNQFNLSNQQNLANFGLGTNQLNAQNALQAGQLNNQMFQNMIGQGLNLNQLGNANTIAALAQLFGGLQQANALGTAQRDTTVTPNPWMQGLQILGQIASGAVNKAGGG